MNLYKIFEEGLDDMKENSSLIFAGLGCIGVAATAVVGVFAGKKLVKKNEIIKEKIEKKKEEGIILTKKESVILHVREKFPAIAPVIIVGTLAVYCICKSYKINMGKIAALSTSVAALTQSRDSYKKIAEKLMDEKELEREKMKQKLEENPMPKEVEDKVRQEQTNASINNIYNTIQPWFEENTNQYITCTESDLVRAFENINYRVKSGESFVPFDDFLWELSNQTDCKIEHPKIAQTFGWPNERCSRGITYNLSDGVKAPNGLFCGKIGYKAYTDVYHDDSVSTI